MNRKSKFYRPKLEGGGLLKNPNLMGGIGAGASALTGLIPSATEVNQKYSGDERYMTDMAKAAKPGQVMDSIGSAAMATGNPFAMAGGLVLKGASRFVGKGAAQKAEGNAFNRAQDSSISQNFKLGALASNSIPKFQAPAYGRMGMKIDPKNKMAQSSTALQAPVRPLEVPRKLNNVQRTNLKDLLNPGAEPAPWNNSSRMVTHMGPKSDGLYIDDAGNIKKKPTDKFRSGGKMKFKSKFNRE